MHGNSEYDTTFKGMIITPEVMPKISSGEDITFIGCVITEIEQLIDTSKISYTMTGTIPVMHFDDCILINNTFAQPHRNIIISNGLVLNTTVCSSIISLTGVQGDLIRLLSGYMTNIRGCDLETICVQTANTKKSSSIDAVTSKSHIKTMYTNASILDAGTLTDTGIKFDEWNGWPT